MFRGRGGCGLKTTLLLEDSVGRFNIADIFLRIRERNRSQSRRIAATIPARFALS
jgi:hypothetical protein